jgi:hypothetical protein
VVNSLGLWAKAHFSTLSARNHYKKQENISEDFLATDEHGLARIMVRKSLEHSDPRKDNVVLSLNHPVKIEW